MRVIGHYRIADDKVVTCHRDGKDMHPYLFIGPSIERMHPDVEVTLGATHPSASYVLNTLGSLDHEDGFLLLFYVAENSRQRVQRRATRNGVILTTGEWGANFIAIVPAKGVATFTLLHRQYAEIVTCDNGVVSNFVEVREAI